MQPFQGPTVVAAGVRVVFAAVFSRVSGSSVGCRVWGAAQHPPKPRCLGKCAAEDENAEEDAPSRRSMPVKRPLPTGLES